MRKQGTWPAVTDVHTIVFDFDGVFTDNSVYVSQDGVETVRCSRGDGLGIDMLRHFRAAGRMRAEIFILSREKNPVVAARAKKLGLECRHAVEDKAAFLRDYLKERGAGPEGLVYLGNDLNDLPAMALAGFSVAPDDAHPLVKGRASVVLPEKGGHGFVRAFVETLIGVSRMTPAEVDSLVLGR